MIQYLQSVVYQQNNILLITAKSYEQNLINRKNTLTPGSSQAEVINVLGPLQTLQRLNRGDKLSNDTGGVTIPIENTNRKTIPTK